MSSPTAAGVVVRALLEALQDGDSAAACALLAPDVERRNSGLPTLRGARAHRAIRGMEQRGVGFAVDIHHLAATDRNGTGVVLTDRTDVLRYRRYEVAFWVCGTFEVRDGLVTLWDDHFSMTNLLGGGVRGLLRLVRG